MRDLLKIIAYELWLSDWRSLPDGYILSQAKKGRWRYEGLFGFEPSSWPRAYARYPDGYRSVDMAAGDAYGYSQLFGGTVHVARA